MPMMSPFTAQTSNTKIASPKKKTRHENWFEDLTIKDLSQLCKASKMPISGSKTTRIARLTAKDATHIFSSRSVTLDRCKAMCRQRLLQVGGTKLELVLRILQSDHDTGGGSLKRVATEIDPETGRRVAKKRRRQQKVMKPADPQKIYARVEKKIFSVSQKKYQTKYGRKNHAPDVGNLLRKIVQEECFEKKEVVSPQQALTIASAAFRSFANNFIQMEPGYGSLEFAYAFRDYKKVVEDGMSFISNEDKIETANWLERLYLNAGIPGSYGLGDEVNHQKPREERENFILSILHILKPGWDVASAGKEQKKSSLGRKLCVIAPI